MDGILAEVIVDGTMVLGREDLEIVDAVVGDIEVDVVDFFTEEVEVIGPAHSNGAGEVETTPATIV